MTWKHPIKYISSQRKMIPMFLTASKVIQVLTFLVINRFPESEKYAFIPLATLQLFLLIFFFFVECYRKRKEHFSSRLLKLIFFRYAIPHFSFMYLTLVILKKFKDLHNPLQYQNFDFSNIVGSLGTLVFVIFKL